MKCENDVANELKALENVSLGLYNYDLFENRVFDDSDDWNSQSFRFELAFGFSSFQFVANSSLTLASFSTSMLIITN